MKLPLAVATLLLTLSTAAQSQPTLAASVPSEGTVHLYRIEGSTLESDKAIPVGKTPGQMCLSPSGSTLFVSVAANHGVTLIDWQTQTITGTLADPAIQRADGCVLSPDGKKLYLADRDGDALFIFSTATRTLLKRLPIAKSPRRAIFLPNGKLLVASDGVNRLSLIDPATDSVTQTIQVADEAMNIDPRILALTPDRKRLVVANVSGDSLGWYQPDTLHLIADYGTRRSPQALVMAPDGKTLYVLSVVEKLIAIEDIATPKEWRVNSTIPLGTVMPLAMVSSSDGAYLYVSRSDATLAAVNLATKTVTTIPNAKAGNALIPLN